MFNLRVILGQLVLLLLVIVETAVMSFGMTVLWAVDVATLAGCLNEANFTVAVPTLTSVCLYEIKHELENGKIEIA